MQDFKVFNKKTMLGCIKNKVYNKSLTSKKSITHPAQTEQMIKALFIPTLINYLDMY